MGRWLWRGRVFRLGAPAVFTLSAALVPWGGMGIAPAGPLLLHGGDWSGDDARAEGVIAIEGDCLYLGGQMIAFPAKRVRWDAGRAAVVIEGRTYRDGDWAAFGGGESGRLVEGFDWVSPPAPSCDASRVWMAGWPSDHVPGGRKPGSD